MLACWGSFNPEEFISVEHTITFSPDLFSISMTWYIIVVVLENT